MRRVGQPHVEDDLWSRRSRLERNRYVMVNRGCFDEWVVCGSVDDESQTGLITETFRITTGERA